MPVDLRPSKARRRVRVTGPSMFPYIMVFVLCALVVIVGTRWPAATVPMQAPADRVDPVIR